MSGSSTTRSPRQQQQQQQPQQQQQQQQQEEEDRIIGLDVCGQVYYCHQSTLTQSSPYFASRFKGDFNAGLAYWDPHGRPVYFLERCPLSFPHIFKYMINPAPYHHHHLHHDDCQRRRRSLLPSFDQNRDLVRSLREEADYFGLVGLAELLQVTRSFSPADGNQGVLHWLGTKKGTTTAYQNPYLIGAIHVGGWVDDPGNREEAMFDLARCSRSRASFVHYQQDVTLVKRGLNSRLSIESPSYLLWCDHGKEQLPVTIDLKSVLLRPSHYSLRVSQCYGMAGDWNFEGSFDGTTGSWDVLHEARSDNHLCLAGGSDLITQLDKCLAGQETTDQQRSEAILGLLEQDYRHTWELTPPPTQFYRYFRIIGAGQDDSTRDTCLHGEGIELYGDIYEE